MIARLALAEAGIDYSRCILDIHSRSRQFEPEYVRLNPNMSVPTLIGSGLVFKDSRDIVLFAFGFDLISVDEQTRF